MCKTAKTRYGKLLFCHRQNSTKNSDDWLVTDLGSFENRSSSARIFVLKDDKMVVTYAYKGTLAERQKLEKGEFLVRNVFERHTKYTDFQRTSTSIYTCSGHVLSLGMIQYTFTGEEHHVRPHKHPRSGKKFVSTAPSTKATLVEEAAERKGPSRIFDETSMKVGGVLDCEHPVELPRDSKQVKNARQRVTSRECEDEFASLLGLAKEDVSVRSLLWTPSPRVVFCIDDIV